MQVLDPLMDWACRESDPSTYISYRHYLKAIENQKESRRGPYENPGNSTHSGYTLK